MRALAWFSIPMVTPHCSASSTWGLICSTKTLTAAFASGPVTFLGPVLPVTTSEAPNFLSTCSSSSSPSGPRS